MLIGQQLIDFEYGYTLKFTHFIEHKEQTNYVCCLPSTTHQTFIYMYMHVKSILTFISKKFRENVTHIVLFAGFLDFC